MTHFIGLVVANELDEVDRILSPFSEHLEVDGYFKEIHDFESMKKHYDTNDINVLCDKMNDWVRCDGVIVDGKLGYISTYNRNSKWDWYQIGGRWDDIITLNYCQLKYIKLHFNSFCERMGCDEFLPSVLVDKDGWHASKEWGWFGCSTDVDGFDLNEYINQHKDEYCYLVDFHI